MLERLRRSAPPPRRRAQRRRYLQTRRHQVNRRSPDLPARPCRIPDLLRLKLRTRPQRATDPQRLPAVQEQAEDPAAGTEERKAAALVAHATSNPAELVQEAGVAPSSKSD